MTKTLVLLIIVVTVVLFDRFSDCQSQATCLSGWQIYNENCYLFNSTVYVNQTFAEEDCVSKGAHLTSINDASELAFINSSRVTSVQYWIGLMKKTAEKTGATYWLDNSTSTYRPWGWNQPNEAVICVYLGANGLLHDDRCTSSIAYICKSSASTATTPAITTAASTPSVTTTPIATSPATTMAASTPSVTTTPRATSPAITTAASTPSVTTTPGATSPAITTAATTLGTNVVVGLAVGLSTGLAVLLVVIVLMAVCFLKYRNDVKATAGMQTAPPVQRTQGAKLEENYDAMGMNIYDNAMTGTPQVYDDGNPYTALSYDGQTTAAENPHIYTRLTGLNRKSLYAT